MAQPLDNLFAQLREAAADCKRQERAARRRALLLHSLLDQLREELAKRGIKVIVKEAQTDD